MRRHYDEVEKTVSVAPAQETVQGKSGVLFERGLHALGHEMKPLMRNAPNCCGSGVCAFGCPTNAKLSMQLNYIPLALQAGARIYTHCCAKQIVYKKRHAVEVVGQFESPEKKGPKIHVKAKVIVVSCGTLHTPILLKRSHVPNIGGQIGKNLTLHPAAKVMALFDEEVKGWEGIPQGYCSEALREEGILLEGTFIPPAITAASLLLTGRSHHETMEQYGHLAMFGMIVSDTSRGRIIRGIRDHAIAMYNINRVDVSKFRKGIKFLADVFFAAGAKRVFLPIHTLPEVTKEEGTRPIDLLRLRKKDIELYAFHPLCTCRMGADPREAALDSNARLYGLDNLFVADGSIFPTSLGVNPMLTIMAAGHKIAEHIHHDIL
jgi:choline dehydrogenase-like flavoprotein